MKASILYTLLLLLAVTPSSTNAGWLEKSSNLDEIERAGKGKTIHIRIVVAESEECKECYYEIMADCSSEDLFPDPFSNNESFTIRKVTAKENKSKLIAAPELASLIEYLSENDFFELPQRNDNKGYSIIMPKDYYEMFIYVKIGGEKNSIHRNSSHLVSREFHRMVKKMWAD